MNLLNVSKLRKSYGTTTIFDGVSFAVDEGEKVGFIGVNGSGKSTLFRIVAGLEPPAEGDIAVRRGTRIGYLSQEPDLPAGRSIRAAVADGRPEIVGALAEYEAIGEALAAGASDHDRLLSRQDTLAAELQRLDGWQWIHQVEATLTRLGVTAWDRPVDSLSGGERKRVALGRTLLARPELLLLDEPTNHLDADTTLFLEEYLIDYPGALMLITHDRYFLDRVVDRMVEVSRAELTSYPGGYTEYLEAQAEREELQGTFEAKRRKLIAQELEWARRSPPARTGKQRARLKRTQALEVESAAFRAKRTGELTLHAPETTRLGRTVVDLHDIRKSYGDRVLIDGFSTMLRAGERIGIIGPNGAGKTTLIRIILGEVAPDSGSVRMGVNTLPAYFDQLRAQLDPTLSIYEAAGGTDWVEIGGRRKHLRSYLEDFLFPTERQQQRVSSLSGGERNRLMLAKLFMQPSNLLVLDEPTNDLDLVTLQVLEAALVEYPGCVLMVTHDRFFLDKIATGLFVFEGNGVVHRHEGGFELYRRLREERAAAESASSKSTSSSGRPAPSPRATGSTAAPARKPTLSWKERKELEGLEERIVEAEARRAAIAATVEDPDVYSDTAALTDAAARLREAEAAIEALYARWAELEERAG